MLELLTFPFVTRFALPQAKPLRRIKAHLAEVFAAHDAVRRRAEVPGDVQRDTGLCAEEALGITSHHAVLPFFMQPGFGRHGDW